MKKLFFLSFFYITFFVNNVFTKGPELVDGGLPGSGKLGGIDFINKFIGEFIQIVFVFAVFALIFSGIYYLISAGNDEKTGKAKKWIIWSLIGVFIASSSWGIVKMVNNINFNF